MKRFLSWLVLVITNYAAVCIGLVVIKLILLLIDWLGNVSVGLSIFFAIVFGGIALGILFLPFTAGPSLTIRASESICQTRNGTRYIVLTTLMFVGSIINLILSLILHSFAIGNIYEIIYSIVFAFSWRKEI